MTGWGTIGQVQDVARALKYLEEIAGAVTGLAESAERIAVALEALAADIDPHDGDLPREYRQTVDVHLPPMTPDQAARLADRPPP